LDKLVTTLYILLLGFQFEQPFDFYQPDVEASSRGGRAGNGGVDLEMGEGRLGGVGKIGQVLFDFRLDGGQDLGERCGVQIEIGQQCFIAFLTFLLRDDGEGISELRIIEGGVDLMSPPDAFEVPLAEKEIGFEYFLRVDPFPDYI
jgi:hypothetical protein